ITEAEAFRPYGEETLFCMIGKFSELPYHTKSPSGRMRTRANGRCCRKTTALGAGIPFSCGKEKRER
ncbi:MAG: hypothetical protein OSJ52_14215, partial [Lachnospiraceae bacterium]|nr:hypothetical protein [Lachnospiraceae bacterium]